MHSDIFDLTTPKLSKGAQLYCAKDVKAPLLAYAQYRKLPNVALRMKPEEVKLVDCVKKKTSNISDVKTTTRGVVVQSSGATQNGMNLEQKQVLINVTEVFDSMLLIHFPVMSSGRWYKCGHKEQGSLIYLFDVKTLKYFGSVPFHIIEIAYRLRKVYDVGSNANLVEHHNSNDEAELAVGRQYDEFDNRNSVNSNRSILCNVSIVNKYVQKLHADIET